MEAVERLAPGYSGKSTRGLAYGTLINQDGRAPQVPRLLRQHKRAILEAVKGGNYLKTAIKSCGVSYNAYTLWLYRGRAAIEAEDAGEEVHPYDKEYADFYRAVEAADAAAEMKHVRRLDEHGENNPAATIAMLERRWSHHWQKHETIEQTGPGGGPLQVITVDDTRDNLADILHVLANAGVLPAGVLEAGARPALDAPAEQVRPAQAEP